MVKSRPPGGMAEWFKATDLKSVVAVRSPGVRIPLPPPYHLPGFDNCIWGGARVADWARLLSECWDLKLSRGFESRPPRQKRRSQLESVSLYFSRGSPEGDAIRIPPSPSEEERVHYEPGQLIPPHKLPQTKASSSWTRLVGFYESRITIADWSQIPKLSFDRFHHAPRTQTRSPAAAL
jgi:hypothetical protein